MLKPVENSIESFVFASRWLQTPLYLGLIVGSGLYCYKFLMQLVGMCQHIQSMSEEELMLGVLGLVDMTMVANLVYMVVVGGYTMFVSRIDIDGHPDRPEWLEQTNANTLKIKLASSLVGVSGIHLLKSFIEIGEAVHATHSTAIPPFVMWQVIIHITFLGTAIALSISERLLHPPGAHAPAPTDGEALNGSRHSHQAH
jgi:uncharacterized protein (TIGR00645 family)